MGHLWLSSTRSCTQLEYFRALAPLLAEKFAVYAVDLPGHGHSPIDRTAQYDEPHMRKGIVGFLEALDLRDVTIVGESIGAVLALTAAAMSLIGFVRSTRSIPTTMRRDTAMASAAATGLRT